MTNIEKTIKNRVILGLNLDSQNYVSLPWHQPNAIFNRNILVLGKTGSRKLTGFVIPNIVNQVKSSL